MANDLKDYYKKELPLVVWANILIIEILLVGIDKIIIILNSLKDFSVAGFIEPMIMMVIPAIAAIFTKFMADMVPSRLKDKIIYWIWGRPGDTIFIQIKNSDNDKRFSYKQAYQKYKVIYDELERINDSEKRCKFENENWYKIYKKYKNEGSVFSAQKDFLFYRDLTVVLIEIFSLYLLCCIVSLLSWQSVILGIILVEIVCTYCIAHIKAVRFVENVIAMDL